MHLLTHFWEAVSAIGTVLSAIVAGISVFFSFISLVLLIINAFSMRNELKETRKSTYADVFKTSREILQDEGVRKSRKFVFNNFKKLDIQKLDDEAESAADDVCTTYDAVGQFIRYGLLPKEFILDNWGYSIEKSWIILSAYLDYIRTDRNAPEIWDDFQWLAGEAIQYRLTR